MIDVVSWKYSRIERRSASRKRRNAKIVMASLMMVGAIRLGDYPETIVAMNMTRLKAVDRGAVRSRDHTSAALSIALTPKTYLKYKIESTTAKTSKSNRQATVPTKRREVSVFQRLRMATDVNTVAQRHLVLPQDLVICMTEGLLQETAY